MRSTLNVCGGQGRVAERTRGRDFALPSSARSPPSLIDDKVSPFVRGVSQWRSSRRLAAYSWFFVLDLGAFLPADWVAA